MENGWVLRVCIAIVSALTPLQGEDIVVCENTEPLNIICGHGELIHIKAANYGRTVSSHKLCPYSAHHLDLTDCVSPGSKVKVSRACNGRQHCSLPVSSAFSDDPCSCTYKYLNVSYQCVRKNTMVVCENTERLNISCGHGESVFILMANYGRTVSSQYVCPYYTQHKVRTDCVSASSEDMVMRDCNGQQHCSLQASNRIFGDPCGGTYKYLSVSYQCIHG